MSFLWSKLNIDARNFIKAVSVLFFPKNIPYKNSQVFDRKTLHYRANFTDSTFIFFNEPPNFQQFTSNKINE